MGSETVPCARCPAGPTPSAPPTWPVVQLQTRTVPSWLPVNSWPPASSISTVVTWQQIDGKQKGGDIVMLCRMHSSQQLYS